MAGGLPYTRLAWSLPSLLPLGNGGAGRSAAVVSRCPVARLHPLRRRCGPPPYGGGRSIAPL